MLQMLGAKGGCQEVVFLFVPGRLNDRSLPGSPLKHAFCVCALKNMCRGGHKDGCQVQKARGDLQAGLAPSKSLPDDSS